MCFFCCSLYTDLYRQSQNGPSQIVTALTVMHRCRPPKTVTDHHRPSQILTDRHRPSGIITDCLSTSQTVTDRTSQTTLWVVFSCSFVFSLSKTITDRHRLSQTIKDHHRLSQTITDRTVTDSHRLSLTIADLQTLYKPPDLHKLS